MPGEENWHLLSPLATASAPKPATAARSLYHTPYGWPAAARMPDLPANATLMPAALAWKLFSRRKLRTCYACFISTY
jgi:hypothetical protein